MADLQIIMLALALSFTYINLSCSHGAKCQLVEHLGLGSIELGPSPLIDESHIP